MMKIGQKGLQDKILSVFSKRRALFVGVFFGLAAALLEAFFNVFPKTMINSNYGDHVTDPLVLVSIFYMVNGLLFTPFTRKDKPISKINRKTLLYLFVIGVIEVASTVFFLYGLNENNAIDANILINCEIIFGVGIAFFILREKVGQREIIPITMVIVGAIVIPTVNLDGKILPTHEITGDIYVILSGLFLGVVSCLYKHISEHISLTRIMQITSFAGALASFIAILIFGIQFEIHVEQIPEVILVGFFGVGVSAFCYIKALKSIGTVKTILVFSSITVFAIFFSQIILGEQVKTGDFASVGLIIGGIVLLRQKISN